MFTVVVFYTIDTPYEALAGLVERDCARLGLTFRSVGYPNTGSWVRNAGLKPEFLKGMLQEVEGDLLYVDADARIRQYPGIFDTFNGDLGVHYRRGTELLSGTIFLKNVPATHKLVDLWVIKQKQNPNVWDQKTLAAVIKEAGFKVTLLSAAYTQIFDTMKHHGAPVIEHMQASRKYRTRVSMKRSNIPNVIGRVRVRESQDGTLYLTRRDKRAEAFLDKHATRIQNQLRWYPTFSEKLNLKDVREFFQDRGCYIVGKGPSLDHLRAEHFTEAWPVICLNESVHEVERLGIKNTVFGLQQDAKLRNTCLPKRGRMFVSVKAANFYAGEEGIYVFDSRHFKLSMDSLSVSAAIRIAKYLGTIGFELLCFDASVNKKVDYAKCIKYDATWGGVKKRFLTHRPKILGHIGELPVVFTIPEALVVASSDTPQPLQHSPKEHHAPARKGRSISLQVGSTLCLGTEASLHASKPDHSDSPPRS